MEPQKKEKYIFKQISSKPLKRTSKEAIIIIIITLIITLLFTYFYYKFKDEEFNEWTTLILSTVVSTGVAAFVYEYAGINNMLAESSIRYAKGSTLDKYKSRRDAILHECYYKLLISDAYTDKHPQIRKNFKLLKLIINNPAVIGKIADATEISKDEIEKYKNNHPKKLEIINEIEQLPVDTIKSLNYISDRLNENMIYDILVNGFDGYVYSGIIIPSLSQKIIEKADINGNIIKEKLTNDDIL